MKRFFCLILIIALIIACFSGCAGGNEYVLFVETGTGDVIRISFKPKGGEYMMYATDDQMIYITTADGINLLQAHFSTLAHVKLLLTENTAYYEKVASFDRQSGNNYEYVFISTKDENTEYGAIGWIPGSNSAFLCASYLTKSSTEDLLKALHFNIKSTEQKNKDYYPLFLDDCVYVPTPEEYEAIFGSDAPTQSTENPNSTLDKETTNGE